VPNTFRNKKVEEGLDESVRTQPAHRRPQIPHDETASPHTDAGEQDNVQPETSAAQEHEDSSAQEQQSSTHEDYASKPRTKSGTMISNMLGGEVLTKQWVRNQRWLLLLIAFFCLVLVSNRYWVEHLTKEKLATEERIKFLREQRIQMKKDYQESVKISHIASELDSLGIGLIAGPPYELTIDKKNNKENKD
jgi:hypothetical protein